MIPDKILNKQVDRKTFLKILGAGLLAIPLMSKSVLGNIFFRNNSGESLKVVTEIDNMITTGQVRTTSEVNVTYDGDFVDEITIGTRVVTFTNDGTTYTKWEDTEYEWTPTYTSDKLTKVEVTEK